MKYKVGDKVKIKTWDQMRKEFPVQKFANEIMLPSNRVYTNGMRIFSENSSDRIVTITAISLGIGKTSAGYEIKEYSCYWDDFMIVGLAGEVIKEVYKLPLNRWQILDLRP